MTQIQWRTNLRAAVASATTTLTVILVLLSLAILAFGIKFVDVNAAGQQITEHSWGTVDTAAPAWYVDSLRG